MGLKKDDFGLSEFPSILPFFVRKDRYMVSSCLYVCSNNFLTALYFHKIWFEHHVARGHPTFTLLEISV
jgi:hypothetical protein